MSADIKNNDRIGDDVIVIIKEIVMIARHLVNNPEDVSVDIERRGYSVLVLLHTNKEDVGQVIGRNAHLLNSIRSLIAAVQGKHGIKIILDYVTDGDVRREGNRNSNHHNSRYY